MSFLSPLFLVGAIAAVVPVLLHLLKRHTEQRVRFAAVALLKGAPYLAWGHTAWIDPAQTALISLGVASTVALIIALGVTRSRPVHGLTEGRRLLDSIGWAVVLPMMLATLGKVFITTGVGDAIANLLAAQGALTAASPGRCSRFQRASRRSVSACR